MSKKKSKKKEEPIIDNMMDEEFGVDGVEELEVNEEESISEELEDKSKIIEELFDDDPEDFKEAKESVIDPIMEKNKNKPKDVKAYVTLKGNGSYIKHGNNYIGGKQFIVSGEKNIQYYEKLRRFEVIRSKT